MAIKEKLSLYQRIRFWLLSAAFTLAGMLTFATTTVVLSTSHVEAATCAILDQGPVSCPSTISGSGCWYKDLGAPTAGPKKDGWVQASSCSNGIFQSAECPPGTTAGACQVTTSEDPALKACTAGNCDLVKTYVDPFINVLAAAVGVVVTISIVVGGIQYASSAGDPGKVQAAKKRIMNAIVALIGFFLFYAVLEWLVPGGLLNG